MNTYENEKENISNQIFTVFSEESKSLENKISDEFFELHLPQIIDRWEKKFSSEKINYCEEEEENETSKSAVEYKTIMVIYFKNGDIYEGEVLKDMRFHGHGQLKWKNGSIYEGSFKNGLFDGFGKLTSSNGNRYIGYWFSGRRHGQGVLVTDKFSYVGEFFNSEFHGNGILQGPIQNIIPKPGDIYLNGYFERNKFKSGVKVYREGIFHGKLNEFDYRIEGEMIYSNNDYYRGEWYENKFCNYGIYKRNIPKNEFNKCIQTIPEQYYGYWLDGKPHGVGILEINEIIIACTWKNGIRHGPGIVIAANGEVFVNNNELFKDGQYLTGFRIIVNDQKKNIISKILEICQENITSENQIEISLNDEYENNVSEDIRSEEISLSELVFESYCQKKQQKNGDEKMSDWFQIKNALDNLTVNIEKPKNKLFPSSLDVKERFYNLIKTLMIDIDNGLPSSFPPTFFPKFSIDFHCTPIVDCIVQSIRQTDKNFILHSEICLLEQIIVTNLDNIENLYRKYATFGIDCGRIDVMLTRIGLFKFFEDVFCTRIQISVLNLIQEAEETFNIHNFDTQNHYQRVYFWQFLKYLLFIAKKFYENPFIYEKVLKRSLPFYGRFGTFFLMILHDMFDMNVNFQDDIVMKMIKDYPDISLKLFDIIKDVNLDIRSVYRFLTNLVNEKEFLKIIATGDDILFPGSQLNNFTEIFTAKQLTDCILKYFPFIKKDNFIVETIFSVTSLDIFRIIFKLFELTAYNDHLKNN